MAAKLGRIQGDAMNPPFCVILVNPAGTSVASRCPSLVCEPFGWMVIARAWRALDHVLTWETEDGAQRFADMNGGTVKPLSEVFDQSVILSPVDSKPLTE